MWGSSGRDWGEAKGERGRVFTIEIGLKVRFPPAKFPAEGSGSVCAVRGKRALLGGNGKVPDDPKRQCGCMVPRKWICIRCGSGDQDTIYTIGGLPMTLIDLYRLFTGVLGVIDATLDSPLSIRKQSINYRSKYPTNSHSSFQQNLAQACQCQCNVCTLLSFPSLCNATHSVILSIKCRGSNMQRHMRAI